MIQLIYDGRLEFGPEALVSVRYDQVIDPVMGSLPESELQVELCTAQPLQPQKEEKLQLLWNGNLFATHFITNALRTGQNRYRLWAKPRLQYLQTKFLGDICMNKPLSQVLAEVFPEQGPQWDASVLDQGLNGYIPPGSRGSALKQITFALGAALRIAENGSLTLCNPAEDNPLVLSGDRTQVQQTQLLPVYTRFELASHRYIPGRVFKDLKRDSEYPPGMVTITFQDPHYDYSVDENQQAWIRQEGSNHVVVEQNGLVSLMAKPYIHETNFATLPGAHSEDPEFSHVLAVWDMTLVSPELVTGRLRQLQEHGSLRQVVRVRYAPGDRLPRVGQSVQLTTRWGSALEGLITGETLTFSAGQVHTELTVMCKEVT